VSFFESTIVIEARRGADGLTRLDLFIAEAQLEIVPFEPDDARAARAAYRAFGKGRHAAGLNFGDCVSYALAIEMDQPLLYKGADFDRTAVIRAV
jgi:ribonuclease VapC